MKKRIAIMFGGQSVEHDISILSTLQLYKAFDVDKYEVTLVYISYDNQCFIGPDFERIESYQNVKKLIARSTPVFITKKRYQPVLKMKKFPYKEIPFDIAFPIVHGQGMEDGTLRSHLDFLQIPCVGSNHASSAIAQDKVLSKIVFEMAEIPQISSFWFYVDDFNIQKEFILEQANDLGYPLIIKPAHLGSSIGIFTIGSEDQWAEVIHQVAQYDTKIVVEKALLKFREFNCAVLGYHHVLETSLIEEVLKTSDILSFDDKYVHPDGSTMVQQPRILPAIIEENLKNSIEFYAIKAFKTIEARGVARIDFLYDEEKSKLFVNEINIIPGSLAYYLFEKMGILLPDLLDRLIELSEAEIHDQSIILHHYEAPRRDILFKKNPNMGK